MTHPAPPFRMRVLAALALASAVLVSLPRVARADEEAPVHTVVSDRVLTLMGLDVEHTLVVGARLPLRPSDAFPSLEPGRVKETIKTVLAQNLEEILAPVANRSIPSALAVAVTLGGTQGEARWTPEQLPWLALEEVTIVLSFNPGEVYLAKGKNLLDIQRGIDDGGIGVGIAAAVNVRGKRYTAAILVEKEIDFAGTIRTQVKSLRNKRSSRRSGDGSPPETNATVGPAPTDDQREELETNATTGPGSLPDQDDDGIESVEPLDEGQAAPAQKKGIKLTLALLADDVSLGGVRDLVERVGGDRPLGSLMSDHAIEFHDVMAVLELDIRKLVAFQNPVTGLSILGRVNLLGGDMETYALLSVKHLDDGWNAFVGFRLPGFTYKDVSPEAEGTLVGELFFPAVALTLSAKDMQIRASALNPAETAFYDSVSSQYQSLFEANYPLNIRRGLNITGPLPLNFLGEAFRRLRSDDTQEVIVEGNPGITFGLDCSGLPRFADLSLRASLPPIAPENGPAWFVGAQLSLEVTGRPSIGLVGEITVDVKGDRLTFFVSGTFARSGAGVAFSLAGGMAAEKPWVAPFGIKWLTLNKVVLKLSVDAYSNVGLGFAADMKIGQKVVDVAVYVQINGASRVPTNFIFEGRTNRLALSDLAELQQRMAKAAGLPAPRLPLGALPNVELRDLYLKFAPKDDPELGVEAGFGIAGQLWIAEDMQGTLDRVAEVDLLVDRSGIAAYGFVHGYSLGPVEWKDAELDFELTAERQVLSIEGKVTARGKSFQMKVHLTARGMFEAFMDAYGEQLADVAGKVKDGAKKAADETAEAARRAGATLRGSARSLRDRLRGR